MTYTFSLKHHNFIKYLCILILFIVICQHPLSAQQRRLPTSPKDSMLVIDYVQRKILQPAIDNLKLMSNDPALAKWLDLLKIEKNMGDYLGGGKAYATRRNGYPIVHIDFSFIYQF